MQILNKRTNLLLSLIVAALTLAAGLIAQNAASEAPAGFTTPPITANAPPQSVGNGLEEPAGDTFAVDQGVFELVHDPTNGLGPVFNGNSCAQCHQNAITGAASQI